MCMFVYKYVCMYVRICMYKCIYYTVCMYFSTHLDQKTVRKFIIYVCMYVCRKNFNLIGCRKIEAVAGALALGYDVVFSDVDIALLKDPIG